MKHAFCVRMEDSTAALLKVIGFLRRRGLQLESLSVVRETGTDSPALSLIACVESDEPMDLLYRQLDRFIPVWEISALPTPTSIK